MKSVLCGMLHLFLLAGKWMAHWTMADPLMMISARACILQKEAGEYILTGITVCVCIEAAHIAIIICIKVPCAVCINGYFVSCKKEHVFYLL